MEVIDEPLKGLFLLRPKIFGDERGYFYESFNAKRFKELTSIQAVFVQDNQSLSQQNVLRGLHFQAPPHAQAKLVRVARGSVTDVVVDIRKDSPTYGQHFSVELNAANHLQLFIPEGFAHGFATRENDTLFLYKCTDYYHPETEGCLLWNDPELNIEWNVSQPIISAKDQNGSTFNSFASPF